MSKTTGDASDGQRSHDDISKMVTTMQYPYPYHQQRWAVSYSQPLAHGDEVGSAARRGAMRKHSLNEDCMVYSEPANPFFSSAHAHAENARSYSYPHHPNLPPHGARHDPSGPHFGGGGLPQLARMESRGPAALPEFIGRGGGTGVFKLPLRAAMLPGRPPPLELRPHPHRETQVGSFLRTIVCTPSQLWAGQESGVRFWSLSDLFNGWGGVQFSLTKVKLGDEESVPFRESFRTSPTLCLAVDAANRLVWSGHKDGKIRSWRMEQLMHLEIPPGKVGNATTTIATTANTFTDDANFKEGLSWHAHRGPVLSLVITSYGELWSGSEGGILKVWPWEAIEKSLSLSTGEKHMAALLVERSFVDLRSLITIGGVCSLPAIDIKYLLSDNSRSKVWSGSYLTFALWDSRTKELLKVFGIDGQVEARVDITPVQDPHIEDEMKMKFVSSSKKEKSQLSFFQRSRNALMGAADAVRRVAVKGAFGDDNRRAEALAMSMDGIIWVGCTNGSLMQWDGNGNRLQEIHHLSSSVKSICAFGTQLWVGYANGIVQIMDLKGNLLGGWVAHSSPIIKMAFGGTYIFTLANHGGIRGWYLASPGPLDSILMSELTNKKLLYTKLENLRILAGTWNVGQERASHDSLITWLGCAASEVGMVVVGLQEVEMGAGFLAMAAAKETVGLEGSANGQWWLDTIGKILDEGNSFDRVGSRQLAGLLIVVWARKYLRPYIGDVDAAAVPCGFGHAIGNKGAVGLRMRVYDRVMCFVNCHFAAHVEAVNRRNADFDHIYRTMAFSRPSSGHHAAACASSAVQSHHGVTATGIQSDDRKPELSEGDMVIFLGDFNYRLHSISYDEARDLVSQRSFDWLRDKDQLRAEMKAGNVFQGMREGQIKFPPTYKFERHQAGLSGYDSGEKKRIPAWCDRILYRDSRSLSTAQCSLDCPVVSSILEYDACIDVTGSDHKPVRCIFNVEIAHVDGLIRRQQYGAIVESNEEVRSLLEECCGVPETIVSTNDIILQNDDTSIIRISNKCKKGTAIYEITCKGQSTIKEEDQTSEIHPRCSFGFPHWLKVVPAVGIIKPGQAVEVSLHHEEVHALDEFLDGIPQNWWCEYTRDMEVILLVSITGSSSTESTSHLIHVRHRFSSKASCSDSKGANRKVRRNLCHRSDITQFGGPSDMADLFRMHCP